MSVIYNADEILEMAVKIEQNGRQFYLKASEVVSMPEAKTLFTELANWESEHEKLFGSMRDKFAENRDLFPAFDPDLASSSYLQAIADDKVFEAERLNEELASVTDDITAIIKRAIQREKDAIVFFSALLNLVPDDLGKQDVENIIQEEYGHIKYLVDKKKELLG